MGLEVFEQMVVNGLIFERVVQNFVIVVSIP